MNVILSTVHYHSKGIPCHGLPGCCAEKWGQVNEGRGGFEEKLRRGGFAIGSFIDNVVLLLLLYLQGRAGIDGLQAKRE